MKLRQHENLSKIDENVVENASAMEFKKAFFPKQ